MGHPFSNPALIIQDTLRVISVIIWLVVATGCISLAVNREGKRYLPATVWGVTAILILSTSAAITEVQRLGHSMFEGGYFWRLPMNLAGIYVSLIAVKKVKEYPKEPPRDRQRL